MKFEAVCDCQRIGGYSILGHESLWVGAALIPKLCVACKVHSRQILVDLLSDQQSLPGIFFFY